MAIKASLSAVRNSHWSGLAIRFLFGGLITVATGLIGKAFGPVIAGLFLAFPAIFPASATMIEKHEKEKKAHAGHDGAQRGRAAAAVDAAGAAVGTFGLVAFSLLVWRLLPGHSAWLALGAATLAWTVVAIALWLLRRRF